MSGKLRVTDEGLCTIHNGLTTASRQLEQVLRRLKNQDSEALGSPEIADRANEFGNSWAYAVQQIGEHAADLDKFIQKVSDTFGKIDQQLQQSLSGKGGQHK